MLALGIDLAAQPSNTGAVFLESAGEPWRAFELEEVPTDDALIGAARRADVLGVDAPFGWPIDFVEAVSAHGAFEGWPGGENRERLTHRETDRAVQERSSLHPLSVSADKLGSTAMRCALLQRRWADQVWDGRRAERDGSDWLVETYPAAALRQWGMQSKGYKNGKGDAPMVARERILDGLVADSGGWLDVAAVRRRCIESDDVLDALVCALIAIACKAGAT